MEIFPSVSSANCHASDFYNWTPSLSIMGGSGELLRVPWIWRITRKAVEKVAAWRGRVKCFRESLGESDGQVGATRSPRGSRDVFGPGGCRSGFFSEAVAVKVVIAGRRRRSSGSFQLRGTGGLDVTILRTAGRYTDGMRDVLHTCVVVYVSAPKDAFLSRSETSLNVRAMLSLIKDDAIVDCTSAMHNYDNFRILDGEYTSFLVRKC